MANVFVASSAVSIAATSSNWITQRFDWSGLVCTANSNANWLIIGVWDTDSLKVTSKTTVDYFVSGLGTENKIIWSKIGSFDFTIDQSNVAGSLYLDWKGDVYAIKRLVDTIIVYGLNGITSLKGTGVRYGVKSISKVGVKNPGCVAGDENEHFYIDTNNELWKLSSQGVEKLDYSEFISQLTSPILNYDKTLGFVYICDDKLGFIYSDKTKSFGQGPSGITGLDSQDGLLRVVSPSEIAIPKFHITTDTYDFDTRKFKTIEKLEVGANVASNLYAMIYYRLSYKGGFRSTRWFLVNPDGMAYPKAYGVEFMFGFKSSRYIQFEFDYFKVMGKVHGYSPLDTVKKLDIGGI
jgi:hypothetical protein